MGNRRLLYLGLVLTFLLVAVPALAAPGKRVQAPNLQWVEETFVDYTHAGPGPHPTTESNSFHLTQGGIKWFPGSDVEYRIIGTEGVTDGNTAIGNTVSTWDSFITTRTFSRDDSTTQLNPCTSSPNTIQWASIDGPGNILATASVCRNVATKEIGGFVITVDTEDSWSIGGSSTTFDVENVLSHEWGHVAGLDHTNAPKDGCLTMYRFASLEEIQKRTLGLGDKLGMNALYGSTDITAGDCGS